MTSECWQAITAVATAASALGTIAAAVIVGVYTRETWRLRKAAEEQLEASIAPLLLLSKDPPTGFPIIRGIDFTRNIRPFPFTVYNAGRGVALCSRLRTRSTLIKELEPLGFPPDTPSLEEYDLSPIPSGASIKVSLPEEKLGGEGGISSRWLEFELFYESASGTRYRTYVRTQAMYFDDAVKVEHERVVGKVH